MSLRDSGTHGGIAPAIATESSAGESGLGRTRRGAPTGLPRWLKPANRVIVALQRLGLAIGTMHLLSVPGRKSGKLHTTPVSPLTVAGRRYIVGGLDGADWVRNARAAGWGIIARGRKAERVSLVELPVEERAAILREFPRLVPHGVQFFVQTKVVESPEPEAFAVAAPRCPVFRVESPSLATEQRAAPH